MKRIALVLILLVGSSVVAETGHDIALSVYQRGIYFDSVRFPPNLLLSFTNDAQLAIATIGRALAAETTYVLEDQVIKYRLPDRFLLASGAILNADPTQLLSFQNFARALQYVPPEAWGKTPPASFTRPYQWTIFADTIKFSSPKSEVDDSVVFEYFRYPDHLDTLTDTVDLPKKFIPLLKEYVVNFCFSRILLTGPDKDRSDEQLKYYETQLLGRPEDAK